MKESNHYLEENKDRGQEFKSTNHDPTTEEGAAEQRLLAHGSLALEKGSGQQPPSLKIPFSRKLISGKNYPGPKNQNWHLWQAARVPQKYFLQAEESTVKENSVILK